MPITRKKKTGQWLVGFEILGSSIAKFNVAMKLRLDFLHTNQQSTVNLQIYTFSLHRKILENACKCLNQIDACRLDKRAQAWPNQSTQSFDEIVCFQTNVPKPSIGFHHNPVLKLRNNCLCSSTQRFGSLISSHSKLNDFPIARWLIIKFLFINWVIWNSKSISQPYIEVHNGLTNVKPTANPCCKPYPLHSPACTDDLVGY